MMDRSPPRRVPFGLLATLMALGGCDQGGAGVAPAASASASPSSAPAPAPSASVAPLTQERVRQLRAGLLEQLRGQKQALTTACWTPSVDDEPAGRTGKYVFNVTIGVDGRVVAWGVDVPRESPSDVGNCIATFPLKLASEPVPRPLEVRLALVLP